MLVNQCYFIIGAGNFLCTAIGGNTISLQNTGDQGNAAAGGTVPFGALVMAAPDRSSNVCWEVDELVYDGQNGSFATAVSIGPWLTMLSSGTLYAGGTVFNTGSGGANEQADGGLVLNTGATATGYAVLNHGARTILAGTGGGNNVHLFHWRVYLNPVSGAQLSNATNRYLVAIGLFDTGPMPSAPSRRASFTYTDTVVSGDWCCEYQKNGAANSQNDSLVALALGVFYDLYLIIDPTNTYWLIGQNNAVPAQVFKTVTANISASTSNGFSIGVMIQKSVGTTSCGIMWDLFERAIIWKYATTPRYSLRGLKTTGS
jgi:hypothetical protein